MSKPHKREPEPTYLVQDLDRALGAFAHAFQVTLDIQTALACMNEFMHEPLTYQELLELQATQDPEN